MTQKARCSSWQNVYQLSLHFNLKKKKAEQLFILIKFPTPEKGLLFHNVQLGLGQSRRLIKHKGQTLFFIFHYYFLY